MGEIDIAIQQLWDERERSRANVENYIGRDRDKIEAWIEEMESCVRKLKDIKWIIEYADGIVKLNEQIKVYSNK
jgi:hypothetical protein